MGYSAGEVIKGIVCQNIAGLAFKAMMDEATFLLGLDARGKMKWQEALSFCVCCTI